MARYKPVTIRMAPATWEAVQEVAAETDMSATEFIRASTHYTLGVRHGRRLAADGETVEQVLRALGVDEDVVKDVGAAVERHRGG